jgi:hypothetical protein
VCKNIALRNGHIKEFQNKIQTHLPEEIGNIHDSVAILSSLQPIFLLKPSEQPLHVLPIVITVICKKYYYLSKRRKYRCLCYPLNFDIEIRLILNKLFQK